MGWGGVVVARGLQERIRKISNKLKKGIQRNERRDSKQDIMKDSESETARKHTGK